MGDPDANCSRRDAPKLEYAFPKRPRNRKHHGIRPMKRVVAASLALFLGAPAIASASNCAGTSTGRIPLVDLGTGTYQGFEGGLYMGGVNARPPAHLSAGLQVASQIVPLDTLGHPS